MNLDIDTTPHISTPLISVDADMEYGAAYLRPQSDATTTLPIQRNSQYTAYRPGNRSQSTDTSNESPSSWGVSPIGLQQSLPPLSPLEGPWSTVRRSMMGSSIFGSRAVLDSPYQETVAWENSTNFRSTRVDSPKPEPTVTPLPMRDQSPPPRKYYRSPRHIPSPWMTGFKRRFPWLGIGALISVLLLTGASVGILLASDKTSPSDWIVGDNNTQPYVYLSALEMIMNLLMSFALFQGVVIKFWRELLHGCTLSTIHDIYESSFLLPALRRMFRLQFNVVVFACVFTAASVARGPLFQRALTLNENQTSVTNSSLDLKIAPFPVPEFFQGTDQGSITPEFSRILRAVGAGNGALPYTAPPDCGGYCTGTVKGFAFKSDCSTSTLPYDLNNPSSNPTTIFSLAHQPPSDSTLDPQKQTLTLTSAIKTDSTCAGSIQIHTCTLTQTASTYGITIANNTIARAPFDPNSLPEIHDDVLPLDKSLMNTYWPLALEYLFPSIAINVSVSRSSSGDVQSSYQKCTKPTSFSQSGDDAENEGEGDKNALSCSPPNTLNPLLLANDPSILFLAPSTSTPSTSTETGTEQQNPLCTTTYTNPLPTLLQTLNALAFHITLSHPQQPTTQRIPLTTHTPKQTYRTNPILLTLATTLTLLSTLLILPLYARFWLLGRKTSLNPLEIARAFGAPVLEGVEGNASATGVVAERGGLAVRYGAVERYGCERRLRVGERGGSVRGPWGGEVFG